MRHFKAIIISLVFFLLSVTQIAAQEDNDWWHTAYDSQTAVGGSSVSTSSATLPVAGNSTYTTLVLLIGVSMILAGMSSLKFTLAPRP